MEHKVLSELDMTLKSLEGGIDHLVHWISEQPHLPNVTDRELLKSFIIGSKSVQGAKSRLDKYFTARSKNTSIFSDRDPTTIEWSRAQKFVYLPGHTKEYYNAIFVTMPSSKEEVEVFCMEETAKSWFMIIDYQLRHQPFVLGQYFILDCKNLTLELLAKLKPSVIAAASDIYENAFPIRLKAMIWFNVAPIAATFYNNVVKYFFSKKLRQRIFLHTEDHTILLKYLPAEFLPQEYGGDNPSIDQLYEKTKKNLEEERDWFINYGTQRSDETKRCKSDNHPEQLRETFRKIEID